MKPEVVKYIYNCYSEKARTFSEYDAVDGSVFKTQCGSFSGGPEFEDELMFQELVQQNVQPQSASALPQAQGYYENLAELNQENRELARNFARQLSAMSDEFELSRRCDSLSNDRTIVQFENRSKFVKSDQGKIQITILRSGDLQSQVVVAWRTQDKNAVAGRHYLMSRGQVEFLPGETRKVIEVQLLDDHMDNCIAFQVELFDPRFVDIGPIRTFNVNINDIEHLLPGVQSTVRSIINAPTVRKVKECLLKNVTVDTFKTALLRLCGESNSLPQELKMAYDLLNCAAQHARSDYLMAYVTNYFEKAPELDQMDIRPRQEDPNPEDFDMTDEDSD